MTETGAEIIAGSLMAAMCVSFLALMIAIVGQKDVTVEMPNNAIDAYDLNRAVDDCTPYQATFEQELACYQAIYGGNKP